jgi:hypothetical protein
MVIQANLKDETLERLERISGRKISKGLDRVINECLNTLEERKHSCKNSKEDENLND